MRNQPMFYTANTQSCNYEPVDRQEANVYLYLKIKRVIYWDFTFLTLVSV